MPTLEIDNKLEVAQAYLAKCESELAAIITSQQYHPATKTLMKKDLESEVKAWKEVIEVLTPKGDA